MNMTLNQINYSLNLIFKDLGMTGIHYSIDKWQIEFGRYYDDSHYSTKSVTRLTLTALDLEVANETEWINLNKTGPFDISDTVDFEESIKALILFHLARLPIQSVELKENADLYLWYTKERFLKIKGLVDIADWVWWIDMNDVEKIIMSNFGKIEIQEEELKKYK